MNIFAPDGYRLVAKTELPGTNGTVVKCYYSSQEQKVFFFIQYLSYEFEVKEKWLTIGPLPKTMLEPIILTMKDVIESPTPNYIEE